MSDASDKLCFLVVDDQPLITGALSMLLTSENPDSEVFTANSVDEARKLVHSHAPEADLLILDLSMPGVVGTSLLEEFVREEPSLKILVLSGVTDRESVMNTLSLGAAGFVPKTLDTDLLLTAIHFVLKGGVYLPSKIIEESQRRGFFAEAGEGIAGRMASAPTLTPRQMDVLRELAKGNPIKRICTNLNLSEVTVKTHVSAIYRAFGARKPSLPRTARVTRSTFKRRFRRLGSARRGRKIRSLRLKHPPERAVQLFLIRGLPQDFRHLSERPMRKLLLPLALDHVLRHRCENHGRDRCFQGVRELQAGLNAVRRPFPEIKVSEQDLRPEGLHLLQQPVIKERRHPNRRAPGFEQGLHGVRHRTVILEIENPGQNIAEFNRLLCLAAGRKGKRLCNR